MSSEVMHEILQEIEAAVQSRPSPIEFEMAYQCRVAVDRIRFAIKHTEQFAPRTDPIREVSLQLLDALQRLEAVDRQFQEQSRSSTRWSSKAESRERAAFGGGNESGGKLNGSR